MPTSVQVTSQPLITKGTPAPSRVTSPSQIKSAKLPFSEALARDVEALSQNVNRLHSVLATNAPTMSRILLTDAQSGNVVAAFGDLLYQGKYYTNFLNEIHVGDPLLKGNPQNALFNANTDGSVTIGQNGWLDVLDPFGGQAAWLGTQNDTLAVTGAANNGSGAIRLTVPGHTLINGNQVRVQGVGGIGQAPPANGTFQNTATGVWSIIVVDTNHVDLVGSVFAGAYTSGGVVDRVLQIAGAANNGSGLIRIQTSVAHSYMSGDQVKLDAVGGVTNANGQWIISVVDTTHFDLTGSTFAGAYTSGGTSLRYFAGMLAQTIAIGPSFANYKLREFADGSLRINNATITLSSPSGQILLDPTLPEISLTNTSNPAKIKLDANPPSLTLYDQSGNAAVAVDVVEETALSITATTNGSPDVITAPGHSFVNGDTVHVFGAAGDTAINGYRIVENLSGTGGTFRLTDLNGSVINGNGSYAGGGSIARYYAGLIAQTVAIGQSFTNYKIRAFADGQLIIKGASISSSSIDGSTTLNGSTINNATLNNPTITGSATGTGSLTEATSSVLTISGGTGAVLGTGTSITVKQAGASQSGYLSSTDWNTFNSKQAALTTGSVTESTSSVLTITGGTGAVIGAGLAIQVKQSSSTVNGYLSSADWATFNGKASLAGTNTWTNAQTYNQTVSCGLSLRTGAFAPACRTVTTATDTVSVNTDHTLILSGVTTESLPATPSVAFEYFFVNIGASAVTLSGNGHNIYVAGVSAASIVLPPGASALLQYDLTNTIWRQVAVPLTASATQSGLLSSSDWTTFNGKQSALTLGSFTEATSAVLTITGGTGAVVGSGLSVQVKQASGTQAGYLSSTDWSTFNNKQAALGFTPLNPANNLSELTASATTARSNLGLGSAATQASTAFDAAGAASSAQTAAQTFAANASNLSSGTVAAARLPNPTATTLGGVQSFAAVSHQFITSISTLGVPTAAQPAFSDISGVATTAQLPTIPNTQISGLGTASTANLAAFPAHTLAGAVALGGQFFSGVGNFCSSIFSTGNPKAQSVNPVLTFSTGDVSGPFQLIVQQFANTAWGLSSVEQGTSFRAIALNPSGGNVLVGTSTDNNTDKLQVNGSINATALTLSTTPLPITSGGTGANTAAAALTNLGVYPAFASFTPTVTGGGMTISAVTVTAAEYCTIGNFVYVTLWVTFTTSGTAGATVSVSVPTAHVGGINSFAAYVTLPGAATWTAAFAFITGAVSAISVNSGSTANWPLGANQLIISGSYRIK